MKRKQRIKREPVSLRLSDREREIVIEATDLIGVSFAEFCRDAITKRAVSVVTKFKKESV
jgi:uncharacterized protein (DUF1778 family)